MLQNKNAQTWRIVPPNLFGAHALFVHDSHRRRSRRLWRAEWRDITFCSSLHSSYQRFSRAGPRGRRREWATLGVTHPLSWLLSNNRLEKVPVVSVPHTSSNRLLLSNQDKGCTPSVAHSLPLPLGPALLNLSIVVCRWVDTDVDLEDLFFFFRLFWVGCECVLLLLLVFLPLWHVLT